MGRLSVVGKGSKGVSEVNNLTELDCISSNPPTRKTLQYGKPEHKAILATYQANGLIQMDKKTDASKAQELLDAKLVELKMPLVLRDYQSYFDATSRHHDRIGRLRDWEISLVTALSVFLLSIQSSELATYAPLYLVIIVFWMLEAGERASNTIINTEVLAKEMKLASPNLKVFSQNILDWEFGNALVAKRSISKLYWLAVRSLFRPQTLFWHAGLVVALSGIVFIFR